MLFPLLERLGIEVVLLPFSKGLGLEVVLLPLLEGVMLLPLVKAVERMEMELL